MSCMIGAVYSMYMVRITETGVHHTYSIVTKYNSMYLRMPFSLMPLSGPLMIERGWTIVNDYQLTFFPFSLRKTPTFIQWYVSMHLHTKVRNTIQLPT